MKVFAIFCTKNVVLAPLGIFALKSKRFNAHTKNNQPTNRLCFRTNHKSKMTSLECSLSQKKTFNTNCTGYLLKRNKHANFRNSGEKVLFAASFLLHFLRNPKSEEAVHLLPYLHPCTIRHTLLIDWAEETNQLSIRNVP